MSEHFVIVYGLVADGDAMFRYIGITKRGIDKRLKEHWAEARQGIDTHKCRWLLKCLREGRAVRACEIVRVSETVWQSWEQAFIGRVPNLTNSQTGGVGALGLSKEARAKIAAKKRGFRHSLAARAKIGAASRGRVHSDETRRRQSLAATGRKLSAEHTAKLAASRHGVPMHPATAAALRRAHVGAKRSASACANISAGQRRRWQEYRDRSMREAQFDIYELLGANL